MSAPPETVKHKQGTGHFLCECGESLVFSAGSGPSKALLDVIRSGALKRGKCPNCHVTHTVPLPKGDGG